ncbi:MAG: hypothetical protein KDA16_05810 [Phycisphaerales bacterium]|nr:hypothetical protein [Phycisphaerales bacterium]
MDEPRAFWFPVVIVAIFTGIWLLAGTDFLADNILPAPRHADTWTELETNVQMRWKLAQAGTVVREWMFTNLLYWPRSAGRGLPVWFLSLWTHSLINVGLLTSIIAVSALGVLGFASEQRLGAGMMVGAVILAFILNAVVMAIGLVGTAAAGSWCMIGVLAALLACGGSEDEPAVGTRVLGIAVIVCLVLGVPERVGGTPVFVAQWLPSTILGAAIGGLHLMATR